MMNLLFSSSSATSNNNNNDGVRLKKRKEREYCWLSVWKIIFYSRALVECDVLIPYAQLLAHNTHAQARANKWTKIHHIYHRSSEMATLLIPHFDVYCMCIVRMVIFLFMNSPKIDGNVLNFWYEDSNSSLGGCCLCSCIIMKMIIFLAGVGPN